MAAGQAHSGRARRRQSGIAGLLAACLAAVALLAAAGSSAGQGFTASLTLAPEIGPVGAPVEASGTVLGGACGVRLRWDDAATGPVLGQAEAAADGAFATEIVIPEVPFLGVHSVFAQGLALDPSGRCTLASGSVAEVVFDVIPSPPPPEADLQLSSSQAQPGEAVFLDASGSTGELIAFEFDLDGNGSYETGCGGSKAATAIAGSGPKTVGVQVTSSDGKKSASTQTLVLAGDPAVPPPKPGGGQSPGLEQGTAVGVCAEGGQSLIDASIEAYNCPTTVSVGVAEAAIPTGLAGDPCFERLEPETAFSRFRAQSKEVLVNGLRINTFDDQLVIADKLKLLTTDGHTIDDDEAQFKVSKPGFSSTLSSGIFDLYWKIDKPGVVGNVGVVQPFGFGTFLGLPYATKATPLRLSGQGLAEFDLFLELPLPKILFKSLASSNKLTVQTLSGEGLIVGSSYKVSIPGVSVGVFELHDIEVSYARVGGSDRWDGSFGFGFPSSGVSADGTIAIADGVLESLAATFNPGPPGIGPIGCCVFIVEFGAALGHQSISASTVLSAGPEVVGSNRAAEATGTATIFYEPFEFYLTVSGAKVVTIPVSVKGQVHVTPSSFAFTAGIDEDFGPFSFTGDLGANVGESNGKIRWSAVGSGDGCVNVIIDACVDVTAGAGTKGVAGCGGITIVPGTPLNDPVKLSGGAIVFWPLADLDIDTFTGCGSGKIKSKIGASAVARRVVRGAGGLRFRLPEDLPSATIAIEGDGDHPQVRLQGPRWVDVTTPPEGEATSEGPGYFASRATPDATTYVFLNHPPKGKYRISALAGSPAVRSVGVGEGIPARLAKGRVTGAGSDRVLRYEVADLAGLEVTFVERGGVESPDQPGESVDRVIGATRGGKGTIEFTPAEATVRERRIEAIVTNQGTPIETELVDRFRAPQFRRLPGPRVTVKRTAKTAKLSWKPVPGATALRAVVDLADAATHELELPARRRSLKLRGLTPLTVGEVEIRALSEGGYLGNAGLAKVKRLPALDLLGTSLAKVLRARAIAVGCTGSGAGECEVTVTRGDKTLAAGTRAVEFAETAKVRAKLTVDGKRALKAALRRGRALRVEVLGLVPGEGEVVASARLK